MIQDIRLKGIQKTNIDLSFCSLFQLMLYSSQVKIYNNSV